MASARHRLDFSLPPPSFCCLSITTEVYSLASSEGSLFSVTIYIGVLGYLLVVFTSISLMPHYRKHPVVSPFLYPYILLGKYLFNPCQLFNWVIHFLISVISECNVYIVYIIYTQVYNVQLFVRNLEYLSFPQDSTPVCYTDDIIMFDLSEQKAPSILYLLVKHLHDRGREISLTKEFRGLLCQWNS